MKFKTLFIAICCLISGLWLEAQCMEEIEEIRQFEGKKYRICCDTRNGGLRYLEAFPNDDLVRLRPESRDQDQIWSIEKASEAPNEFYCPITLEVMVNPVVASDGFSYEREAIHGWMNGGNRTSPMTRLPFVNLELLENIALRRP